MEHLHTYTEDPLDIDKPGYYFPKLEEFFTGFIYEQFNGVSWAQITYTFGSEIDYSTSECRVRYLQAKDIQELGFGRVSPGLPMYQRGTYTITTKRLYDPSYSSISISQHGVIVWQGMCKNKSELKRILILNEINFVDSI